MMLEGKTAIVTGGSRGIGYAIVKKFLENGAKVALFGSKPATVDKAMASLKEINPDWPVIGLTPDLKDDKAVEAAILEVKDTFGALDILVNNAGVYDATPIEDYTFDTFGGIMDINLNAMVRTIIPAVKIMREQGGGVILNTSSVVSFSGQAYGVAYPVSKSAVSSLTWSLARELGPSNIRVNAISPGVTNTDMVNALPDEMVEPTVATIPLRRMGQPEDLANAALFLASDMASYITGAVLPVDGAVRP